MGAGVQIQACLMLNALLLSQLRWLLWFLATRIRVSERQPDVALQSVREPVEGNSSPPS